MRLLVALLSLTALVFVVQPARAWGPQGHRVIAELAEARLTPAARAEVDRLLAQDPGATLASVASWADETRSPETLRWHFVNLPRNAGCRYDAARDCAGGQCVVAALQTQLGVLASTTASPRSRYDALRYVVHFAGDIHQPLHVAFGDDRGGNGYQISVAGEGSNLHAWWDSGMIRRHGASDADLRRALAAKPPLLATIAAGSPADWVREGCELASSPGFYPPHRLDAAAYQQRWWPVVDQRLRLAGERLARMLNQALGAEAGQ